MDASLLRLVFGLIIALSFVLQSITMYKIERAYQKRIKDLESRQPVIEIKIDPREVIPLPDYIPPEERPELLN